MWSSCQDASMLLLFVAAIAALTAAPLSVTAAPQGFTLLNGCDLAAPRGNNSNLDIHLTMQAPATELQLRFADCTLEGVNITLIAPNSESSGHVPSLGTSIVLERFTMRNGSFIITPAMPIAADVATRPLIQNISVTARHVVMEGLVDALVLNATAAVKAAAAEAGAIIAASNVTFEVSDSTMWSLPSGNALSIAAGDAAVVGCSIHVRGSTTIAAGGWLAASVAAAVVNNTNLTADNVRGSVVIAAVAGGTLEHNGVAALGIVQYRDRDESSKASTLLLSNVHIAAGSQHACVRDDATTTGQQPLLPTDASSSTHQLAITAAGHTCIAAAGACSAHELGDASVVVDGGVFTIEVGSLQGTNDRLLAAARVHAAAAAGVATHASAFTSINITGGANVRFSGWAFGNGTIKASAGLQVATALGMAGFGQTSSISATEGANVTLLGWAGNSATIQATGGNTAAATLGMAFRGTSHSSVKMTRDSIITMQGWAQGNATIQATAHFSGAAAALGIALAAPTTTVDITYGANVTLFGCAGNTATIQAIAAHSAAAVLGLALESTGSLAAITISADASVTIFAWARDEAKIQASADLHVATAAGLAMYGLTSSIINIAEGASVTMFGWAGADATIQATAGYTAAAALGMALTCSAPFPSSSSIVIAERSTFTIQGSASDNATIQATTLGSAAAATFGMTLAAHSTSINVTGGAEVTMLGWATGDATIESSAGSSPAATLGMALSSSSTTINFAGGANVTMQGWAHDSATIQATAAGAAAALGMALRGRGSTSHSTVVIAKRSSVTIEGSAWGSATIQATANSSAAAAALGMALDAPSTTINITDRVDVTLLGWAMGDGTISANAASNAAAAIGMALYGSSTTTTTINITEGANITIHGWARDNATIEATSGNSVVAALGMALRSSTTSIVSISGGATATILGWGQGNATIAATSGNVAAALGMALYTDVSTSGTSAITPSDGASVTMLGWADDNAILHATANVGYVAACLGMALYCPSSSSGTATVTTNNADVTILGWAMANATIEATASRSVAAAIGMALFASSTIISVTGADSTMLLMGWAQEDGKIHAAGAPTVTTYAAAAIGMALYGSVASVTIEGGANVTMLGRAHDNATIGASVGGSAATVLGMALYSSAPVSTITVAITIRGGANVTLMGWAQENATIQATTIHSAAAALGMALYASSASSSSIGISEGATLTLLGWSQDENAMIKATTGYHGAAALGMALVGSSASAITIIDGANVTLQAWVARNGKIRGKATNHGSALGLFVPGTITVSTAEGARAAIVYCHDNSGNGIGSGNSAAIGSSPVISSSLLQIITSSDLTPSSMCGQESARREAEADPDWAVEVLNRTKLVPLEAERESTNASSAAAVLLLSPPACSELEQLERTRTQTPSSSVSPSLIRTPTTVGSASSSASEAPSRSTTTIPTTTASTATPSVTGATTGSVSTTTVRDREPSIPSSETQSRTVSFTYRRSSPSSSPSASSSECSTLTPSVLLPPPQQHDVVRLPRENMNTNHSNGTNSPRVEATLMVTMMIVNQANNNNSNGQNTGQEVSGDAWRQPTSDASGTSFDVPFDVYTTRRLCILARFPHTSLHSWRASSPSGGAAFYASVDTARTTFSEQQLNITIEKKLNFELKICVGAIDGDDVPEGSQQQSLQRVMFSLNEDAVQPQPAGFNTTERIIVHFHPGWKPNEGAATAVTVANGVSGATSLIGAGPTAAAVSNRQQLLTKIVMCPQPMIDEPLGSDQAPLGLQIGSGFLRYEAGAMYGNLLFFAALAVVYATITYIVGSQVNPHKFAGRVLPSASSAVESPTAWQRGRATLRFPGRLAPVAVFLYQSTLSSSLRVVLYTEDTNGDALHQYIAIVIVVLLVSAFILLPVASSFVARVGESVSHVPRTSMSFHSFVQFLTDASGEWASMSAKIDPLDRPVGEAVERFGTAFEDYRPECVSTIYFDFSLATVCACAAAINPINRNQCSLLSLFVAGVFFLAVVVAVGFRPFDSRLNNIFYSVIAITQFVSAVAINAIVHNSSNSTDWLSRMEIADVVLYYTITVWCLMQVAEGVYCTVQATGVPPGLPTFAEAMDTVAFNTFCARFTQQAIVDRVDDDEDLPILQEPFDPTVAVSAESEVLETVDKMHPVLADTVDALEGDRERRQQQSGAITVS